MICPKCGEKLTKIVQPVRLLGSKVAKRSLVACTGCRVVVRLHMLPKEWTTARRPDVVHGRDGKVVKAAAS